MGNLFLKVRTTKKARCMGSTMYANMSSGGMDIPVSAAVSTRMASSYTSITKKAARSVGMPLTTWLLCAISATKDSTRARSH